MEAGQRALVVRRVLTSSSGELMSRGFGALVIDLKRTYLELRPALARVYVNAVDVAAMAGIVEPMGFVALPGRVPLGGVELGQWALEFGPGSVDGWLARHVEIETDQLPVVPTVRTDSIDPPRSFQCGDLGVAERSGAGSARSPG